MNTRTARRACKLPTPTKLRSPTGWPASVAHCWGLTVVLLLMPLVLVLLSAGWCAADTTCGPQTGECRPGGPTGAAAPTTDVPEKLVAQLNQFLFVVATSSPALELSQQLGQLSANNQSAGEPLEPAELEAPEGAQEGELEEQQQPANSQHHPQEESVETDECAVEINMPGLAATVIYSALYSLTFAFGMVGNLLNVVVIARKIQQRRQNATDLLIVNLSLSDLMLCVCAIPITPVYQLYHGYWVFGLSMCKSLAFAMSASVYVSTLTSIAIAYNRYQLVVNGQQTSVRKALLMSVLIWTIAFAMTLPYIMTVSLLPPNCPRQFCDETWEGPFKRKHFSILTLTVQCITPSFALFYYYRKIYIFIRTEHEKHMKRLLQNRPAGATGDQIRRAIERQRKLEEITNKMVLLVVLFTLAWVPLDTYNVVQDSTSFLEGSVLDKHLFLISHLSASASVCCNPILYAFLDEQYRRELEGFLPTCLMDAFPTSGQPGQSRQPMQPSQQSQVLPSLVLALASSAHTDV